MELALADAAVAEDAHRHAIFVLELRAEPEADGHRHVCGHDRVAAEEALRGVEDVHRAAAPAVRPIDAGEELGHDAVGVESPRQGVPVVAVVGEDVVLLESALIAPTAQASSPV